MGRGVERIESDWTMTRLNKQQRKALLKDVKRREMAAAFAALPISNEKFEALFDWLNARLPVDGCDHTRKLTIAHIREHNLPEESILNWLDTHGGFCDCEVLFNSEQAWRECKDYRPDD